MKFISFTTNGWMDESGKYVIIANPDTKTFEVRYYNNGFNVSNLLLNIEQPYIIIGSDIKNDDEAVMIAENHMNPIQTTKVNGDAKSVMSKTEKLLCDIAHLILDTLE